MNPPAPPEKVYVPLSVAASIRNDYVDSIRDRDRRTADVCVLARQYADATRIYTLTPPVVVYLLTAKTFGRLSRRRTRSWMRGARNRSAKLNPSSVYNVRARWHVGEMLRGLFLASFLDLGSSHGVTPQAIRWAVLPEARHANRPDDIGSGANWTWLRCPRVFIVDDVPRPDTPIQCAWDLRRQKYGWTGAGAGSHGLGERVVPRRFGY